MISFTVYGNPVPKGSTRAFVVGGKAITTAATPKTKEWQGLVAKVAQDYKPEKLYDGPVTVCLEFYVQRPKSVSEKKRPWPTVKPDIDKLIRCSLDGLKGTVYTDDARVVGITAIKHYGEPRVEVAVWENTYKGEG